MRIIGPIDLEIQGISYKYLLTCNFFCNLQLMQLCKDQASIPS